MKILFCGGGTAGHVMPAIAMAEIALCENNGCEVAFVGRNGGNENRSIIKEGYKLYTLDVMGMSRSISFRSIKAIIKAIKSGRIAKRIISEFSPDIVIGTGGYVSYPVIRAAQSMNIPTMMHESNVYPGLVTRLLGKGCNTLLLNSEGTKKYLKRTDNTLVIGNPLRVNFSAISRADARKKLGIKASDFFIVSFGGSLGAEILNTRIMELMRGYSAVRKDVRHIHASGVSHYNAIKSQDANLTRGVNGCKILPYIDDMPTYLNAADLVISRSGAMTISELAEVGVASILVPSPNVAENHQYVNAKYVADLGGALMIEEKDLTAEALTAAVECIRSDPKLAKNLAANVHKLSRADTADLFIKAINNAI